jgi:hypothetical protein
MQTNAKSKVKSVTVEAVVIRKDGTREDLGAVSYWSANPFKNLAWKLKNWMRGRKAGAVKKGS